MRYTKSPGIFLIAIAVLLFLPNIGSADDVAETGQTKCYNAAGTEITCATTGQDADIKAGVAWPIERFTDNGNGTVTDNLTGLMWLKDANCMRTNYGSFDTDYVAGSGADGGYAPNDGAVTWQNALDFVNGINNGTYPDCAAGYYNDWRMPNVREMKSLSNFEYPLPGAIAGPPYKVLGTAWADWVRQTFDNVVSCDQFFDPNASPKVGCTGIRGYWTSTSIETNLVTNAASTSLESPVVNTDAAYVFDTWDCYIEALGDKNGINLNPLSGSNISGHYYAVWPVRGPTSTPGISVSPTSHDFGSVEVDFSVSQTFIISNSSTEADLIIKAVYLTGENPYQFDIQYEDCSGATIAPSESCTVEVMFSPTKGGELSAILGIGSNAPTPRLYVGLSGTGVAVRFPDISASPASKDFGSVVVGSSDSQTFIISNSGTADLMIRAVYLTGENPYQFSIQSDNCSGAAIAPSSGSCTVEVMFDPTKTGDLSAVLGIGSNDPDTPRLYVGLSGTGIVTDFAPDISADPASKDFGSVYVGFSASQTFTISNNGAPYLVIRAVYLTGENPYQFSIQNEDCSGATIAPSENCTVNVVFSPTKTGDLSAVLGIGSNDPDTPRLYVRLSGTGAPGGTTGDVWIVPPGSTTVSTNTAFDLEVHVNTGAEKLGAYNFEITFDPTLVNVDGVDAGTDGFIAAVTTDNIAGTLTVDGFDILGTGPGIDLQVLIIHFTSLVNSGTTNIGLSVPILRNEVGVTIGIPNGIGGAVTVTENLPQ